MDTKLYPSDIAAKAIADERNRVKAIAQICMGEYNAIQEKAVAEGWTPERTSSAVLQAIRDARPIADEEHFAQKMVLRNRLFNGYEL